MSKTPPTIKDLFPALKPEEEKEAEENLRRYLAFIVRLYERIVADPKEHERLKALTAEHRLRTMENGRTFTSNHNNTDT